MLIREYPLILVAKWLVCQSNISFVAAYGQTDIIPFYVRKCTE